MYFAAVSRHTTMGRRGLGWALECLSLPTFTGTCLCTNLAQDPEANLEIKPILGNHGTMKLKDVIEGDRTLAFHLEPKTVILRVSMHCNGCVRKVEKQVSKIEGVTSFQADLETKKVVVVGDVTPLEVLESVSKIKFAELWPLDNP